jgi:DNA-directed RNA polymerase subunit E"
MASRKACKKCKILVEGSNCPICKGNQFSDNWKGRIIIMDPEKSIIAKRAELKVKGEYAVKV